MNQIRDLVKKYDLYLFSDEVYREYIYTGSPYISAMHLEGIEQNTVLIDSVSKRYSECGIRVGALITKNAEIRKAVMKFCQARLSPPLIGQIVAEASLDAPEEYYRDVYDEYVERRKCLIDGLNRIPGVYSPIPMGAFYTVAKLPIDDSDKFCRWCLEEFDYEGETVMMAKDTQTLPLLETSEEQKAKYVEQAKKTPTPFLYKALQLMNNCDVQYRQSSNKRLLVELTLIQIGQITQPEDQDVPSAGRTPHRLKSLFQKIVAQLKPASQGAGAGQESGSKAPITGAQPVAAATAAPISTEKNGSEEAASAASPKAKTILKSPAQVKLKGIGMSFANLEKTEQNSQRIYNPIDQLKEETPASTGTAANHDQPFTQEQVEGQWISMCLRMQGIKDFIGLANRMKPIVPTITDFPHIEVVIDNKLLLDDVVKIKGRILQTFRIGLNNSQVTIDYRLAESDEVTRILSKREILENMIKENPAIGKLTQDLRLVMA